MPVIKGSGRLVTVEPIAGLGNRLRVLAAGVILAKAVDSPLEIVWTRTPDLNCRFSELFDTPTEFSVRERSWTMSRLYRHTVLRLRHDGWFHDGSVHEIDSVPKALARFARIRRPYIATCSRFLPAKAGSTLVTPSAVVRRTVGSMAQRLTAHTVGVHIRRSDNEHSKRHSPTDDFIAAMRRVIEGDAAASFFVSSDDATEIERLSHAFPERVLTLTPDRDRGRPAAAIDALTDLECLSRCRLVLGSYYSSFSEVASERGDIPLQIVGGPQT